MYNTKQVCGKMTVAHECIALCMCAVLYLLTISVNIMSCTNWQLLLGDREVSFSF